MSFRLFRHTLEEHDVGIGTDDVIGGANLPSEGVLNNIWGEVHAIVSTPLPLTNAVMYGCRGLMLQIDDVDTASTFSAIWDTQVPKDQAATQGGFDLSGVTDATPEFEPGEPDISKILDYQLFDDDAEWFRRHKLISFATSKGGFLDATPDVYSPTDFFKVRSRKSMPVEIASIAALGFSAPALDATTTTLQGTPSSEAALISIKYMEVILEQAWMHLVGLVESGAETPYEEATTRLVDFLEPLVFEETAASFNPIVWVVYSAMTFDITVPGRRQFNQISIN